MTIDLISFPEYFQPTVDGTKRHELRASKDVPGIDVGSFLHLKEVDRTTLVPTGRTCLVEVTYISPNKPWLDDGKLMSISLMPSKKPHPDHPERTDFGVCYDPETGKLTPKS